MSRIRQYLPVAALAVIATLLSSYVPREVSATYGDIMGCEPSCRVVAGGWPFAYLVDYPGISVVGRVGLFDALLGVDKFWWGPFAATCASWAAFFAACIWMSSRSIKKSH